MERTGETERMQVMGAILCGGQSKRFGSDKALAYAGSRRIGDRVVAALRDGGADPVTAIGGAAGHALGLPTVPDLRPGQGPLGGLATALLFAKVGHVLVTPCDVALLSADHVAALLDAIEPGVDQAVVATVEGVPQHTVGCWPATWGRRILGAVDGGSLAHRSALEMGDWIGVEVPAEAVIDVDTPAELVSVEQRLKSES